MQSSCALCRSNDTVEKIKRKQVRTTSICLYIFMSVEIRFPGFKIYIYVCLMYINIEIRFPDCVEGIEFLFEVSFPFHGRSFLIKTCIPFLLTSSAVHQRSLQLSFLKHWLLNCSIVNEYQLKVRMIWIRFGMNVLYFIYKLKLMFEWFTQ